MGILIAPALTIMADVYRLSASGGAESDRFAAYREAAQQHLPVYGYNPMTSEPILRTIEGLIDLDAETVALQAANAAAEAIGFRQDSTMHLTVATPGMWTDRLATEVDHRLKASDPVGVLLWIDDPLTAEHIREQVGSQITRLAAFVERGGQAPATLLQAVSQEGKAQALSGITGEHNDNAADILEILGSEQDVATMVAFLYGDDAASKLGYTPLGLADNVGYSHAASLHS